MGKPVITEDMRDNFIEDYRALGNVAALARKWGVNWRTADGALRRVGVDVPEPVRRKTNGEYHPKLGVWTDERVAKDLGITKQAVHHARTRRGIRSAYERAMSIMNEE